MKVLVSCANGAGSSLMLKNSVVKAADALGLKIQKIHHCAISEGKSSASQYDVVFTPMNFVSMFKDAEAKGTKIIGIRNIMSPKEAEEGFVNAGFDKE